MCLNGSKVFVAQCSFADNLKSKIKQPQNQEILANCKTPVWEFFNCYYYFLRLPGFPDLFGKAFPINLKFS